MGEREGRGTQVEEEIASLQEIITRQFCIDRMLSLDACLVCDHARKYLWECFILVLSKVNLWDPRYVGRVASQHCMLLVASSLHCRVTFIFDMPGQLVAPKFGMLSFVYIVFRIPVIRSMSEGRKRNVQ